MNFREALKLMKDGVLMKLPSWGGFWKWNEEKQTIEMFTKEGRVLDIRETERVEYTLLNVCSDEWIPATEENCTLLGGTPTFTFSEALGYIKRGLKLTRKSWNGKGQYVFLAKDLEFVTDVDLSELAPKVYVYDALAIRTADKKIQVGWLASQTDMLADDWMFAE